MNTVNDLIENDIRIEGIWPVLAYIGTMDSLDSFDDFASDMKDDDLDLRKILQIPDECEEDYEIVEFLCNTLSNKLLVAKAVSPVKEGGSYSWGYTQSHYVSGSSLEEIYENAYRAFIKA